MAENAKDLTLEREQEMMPIARELLKRMVSNDKLALKSIQTLSNKEYEEYTAFYQKEVVPFLKEKNPKLNSLDYMFALMLTILNNVKMVVETSFETNKRIADAKKYGLADPDDMRVMDLEKALKEPVDK